jgi:hypothetical protein
LVEAVLIAVIGGEEIPEHAAEVAHIDRHARQQLLLDRTPTFQSNGRIPQPLRIEGS